MGTSNNQYKWEILRTQKYRKGGGYAGKYYINY